MENASSLDISFVLHPDKYILVISDISSCLPFVIAVHNSSYLMAHYRETFFCFGNWNI